MLKIKNLRSLRDEELRKAFKKFKKSLDDKKLIKAIKKCVEKHETFGTQSSTEKLKVVK